MLEKESSTSSTLLFFALSMIDLGSSILSSWEASSARERERETERQREGETDRKVARRTKAIKEGKRTRYLEIVKGCLNDKFGYPCVYTLVHKRINARLSLFVRFLSPLFSSVVFTMCLKNVTLIYLKA